MTQRRSSVPNLELGDFLATLQKTVFVGNKHLSISDICHSASMSSKTYMKVKGRKYKPASILRCLPHLSGGPEGQA